MAKRHPVNTDPYNAKRRSRKRWHKITMCLAAVVVFCTTYALILPAITMENGCTVPEHTHDESCYTQVTAADGASCAGQPPALHQHTEECYDAGGALICGYADFVIHTHDAACYDEQGALWCTLPEIREHTHEGSCYAVSRDTGEDGEQEGDDGGTAERVLCCQQQEVCFHRHTDSCYNDAGERICGMTQILRHQHDETCRAGAAAPDGETLTCTNTDPTHTHTALCYGTWELTCGMTEHTHSAACGEAEEPSQEDDAPIDIGETLTQETQEAQLTAEVEAQEALGAATEEDAAAAQALLRRLEEAYREGRLSEEAYPALYARVQALLTDRYDSVAEACYGANWVLLRDSGYFSEYSEYGTGTAYRAAALRSASQAASAASAVQIVESGGTVQREDDGVSVSKTIAGTEVENVFDITLTVQTPRVVDEIVKEPDMAVVIVMDISNTMRDNFGDMTRYEAAMTAAEKFLDKFADNNSMGISKVGYVAFNTDAHQIFSLQPCTDTTQANALKNAMRTATGAIISQEKYSELHSRFTNIEAGLKMAGDMLDGVANKNKFVIFLSDGFPTTYISSGYAGYDPYDSTGAHFYDRVLNKPTTYGTSYSDEAAIRARQMASSMKNKGVTIFSIGVDVGSQTVQKYVTQSENAGSYSVVDRTSTTYEIGAASDTEAYKNWLGNSIGSGYYYDSTNMAGLQAAYEQIFAAIKQKLETASAADWVAEDPIPAVTPDEIEFIGLYDQSGGLQTSLTGAHTENGENTAAFSAGNSTIRWDLKASGYTSQTGGNTTVFTYSLRYRVRLKNEDAGFKEGNTYVTNGTTTLRYRVVTAVDGVASVSEPKTVDFPVPSVQGYLAELTFIKQDDRGNTLAGAEFTLHHDSRCAQCRGDGTAVTLPDYIAVSGEDGVVTFADIPSGHTYTLTETKIPPGYSSPGIRYTVTVAYDRLTVTAADSGGDEVAWNGVVVNNSYYELPDTGGTGAVCYTLGGALLTTAAAVLLYIRGKRRKGERSSH